MKRQEEDVWFLLADKLAHEATKEDLEELEQLLVKNHLAQTCLQLLSAIWQQSEGKKVMVKDAYVRHLQRMKDKHCF
jgi:hypothetical protein